MKLKNILLVVSDIEKSKVFYKELFGLEVITDFGENVILTEGLVLQERSIWEKSIGKQMVQGSHNAELYFEENNMETFLQKLKESSWEIEYLMECTENNVARKSIRMYDPDKHIIEVAEVVSEH